VSFWTCGTCGGRREVWNQKSPWHDGRWERCWSCRGGGDGWGVTLLVVLFFAALLALYTWFCAGAPTYDVVGQTWRVLWQ
jgi:hypothetical protein